MINKKETFGCKSEDSAKNRLLKDFQFRPILALVGYVHCLKTLKIVSRKQVRRCGQFDSLKLVWGM